jgi:PAS domain S-box-containing protein
MPPPLPARDSLDAPLRISLLYAAFGAVWIVTGDVALWLRGGITRAGLLLALGKGSIFVAASALLLYVLIRREVARRQRAAAQLESVLDTAPIGIAAVSADGSIRGWNAAASRILGWNEGEVTGLSAEALGLQPTPGSEHADTYDIAVNARDGTSVDIRMFVSVRDTAGDGGRVLVFRDQRPEMAIEAALRQSHKLEAVGRLAGGIAHEFNNILTTIIGHAVMLTDRLDETDERREHASEIQRSAERAASLTRQLLVFSGKHIARTSSIDIGRTLTDMRTSIERVAGSSVSCRYELEDDLWSVRCDTAQLHQLILNLIINASEAMPHGGTITMRTANVHVATEHAGNTLQPDLETIPEGDYVLLRVGDTGAGMSPDTLAHLFEPFFTTKEQGTGLGLATVHGIVQQSDGYVRVRSRPGHGAVFDIYLPRSAVSESDATAVDPAVAAGASLLVVEDDDAVRELTCRILRRAGHRVVSARNGHEALAVLRSVTGIRLVIVDIVMPGMNGIELSEHIRRDLHDLPILFTSGYVAPDAGDAVGLADGSRFMEKPYTPDQLIERVNELLQ